MVLGLVCLEIVAVSIIIRAHNRGIINVPGAREVLHMAINPGVGDKIIVDLLFE